jgi:hypothetical protein
VKPVGLPQELLARFASLHPIELVDASIRGLDAARLLESARR